MEKQANSDMADDDRLTPASGPSEEGLDEKSTAGRRAFIRKTSIGAAAGALTHFLLLGGGGKVWATIGDCATSDNCPSASKQHNDDCKVGWFGGVYPDSCLENGDNTGDVCGSGENDSIDICKAANPGSEYDSCDGGGVENPDECVSPYAVQNGDVCRASGGPGSGDLPNYP